MAGYIGYSRSVRAGIAEAEGKLPLSRAIPAVARAADCTRAAARAALEAAGPCEWHHASKEFNRVNFYDVAAVARRLRAGPVIARLEGLDFRGRLDPAMRAEMLLEKRLAARDGIVAALAAEAGTTADVVIAAYYDDWAA